MSFYKDRQGNLQPFEQHPTRSENSKRLLGRIEQNQFIQFRFNWIYLWNSIELTSKHIHTKRPKKFVLIFTTRIRKIVLYVRLCLDYISVSLITEFACIMLHAYLTRVSYFRWPVHVWWAVYSEESHFKDKWGYYTSRTACPKIVFDTKMGSEWAIYQELWMMFGSRIFFHTCSGRNIRVWVRVRVYARVRGLGLGLVLVEHFEPEQKRVWISWTGTRVEENFASGSVRWVTHKVTHEVAQFSAWDREYLSDWSLPPWISYQLSPHNLYLSVRVLVSGMGVRRSSGSPRPDQIHTLGLKNTDK